MALSVCKRLEEVVKGSAVLDEPLPDINFTSFSSQRGLDYSGDEVRLAQPIAWKSLQPSLPPEVGCLDICDFCYGEVAHVVSHIDEMVLSIENQVRLKPPPVMIQGDGWGEEVACGLVKRGLCEVVYEETIYKVSDQLLLNGLFSVAKDEVTDDVPLSRLTMNLKPWNMVSRSLVGDVGALPSITQLGLDQVHGLSGRRRQWF